MQGDFVATSTGPLSCQKAQVIVGRGSEEAGLASPPAGQQGTQLRWPTEDAQSQLRVLRNVKE